MADRRNRSILLGLTALALGLSAALAVGAGLAPLVAWLAGWSVATFAAYGADKTQAVRGGWRIPELGLHGLALSGGAAGGWLGMVVFRHKLRHAAFIWVLAAASIIQAGLLVAITRLGPGIRDRGRPAAALVSGTRDPEDPCQELEPVGPDLRQPHIVLGVIGQ